MAAHSAPTVVAPRPPPKPPDPAPSVPPAAPSPDQTLISSLTTMDRAQWEHWLSQGGARSYSALFPTETALILDGITNGVTVDYEGDRLIDRYGPNLPIELEHYAKVSAVIAADVRAGKKAGPFAEKPFPVMCVSPIGAVPKKNGGLRVIHHLSYPHGGDSVNAGVRDVKIQLSKVAHGARAIAKFGKDCWLVKLDVEAAYKQVPVRREDWPLLGFKWLDQWYYERVLPFGLRSSCRLWEMYATALHHLLEKVLSVKGDPRRAARMIIHYVDDFLIVAPTEELAGALRDAALALCKLLGIPMAADKTEGPVQKLTFLGIELDSKEMQMRLSTDKLQSLRALLEAWEDKSHASVKDVQSLVGILNFACAVVRPGRYWLRGLIAHMRQIEKACKGRQGHHAPFPIPRSARADVSWWRSLMPRWNGHSIIHQERWERSDKIRLTTDACGTGFGAMFGSAWFAGAWSPEQLAAAHRNSHFSMPFLELHALVQAAATWGPLWRGRNIIFLCDAHAVVDAIKGARSRDPGMMALLRHLCLLACEHDFVCEHIAGVTNVAADLLSRDGASPQFRAQFSDADLLPTTPVSIPLASLQQLVADAALEPEPHTTPVSPSPTARAAPTRRPGNDSGRGAPRLASGRHSLHSPRRPSPISSRC